MPRKAKVRALDRLLLRRFGARRAGTWPPTRASARDFPPGRRSVFKPVLIVYSQDSENSSKTGDNEHVQTDVCWRDEGSADCGRSSAVGPGVERDVWRYRRLGPRMPGAGRPGAGGAVGGGGRRGARRADARGPGGGVATSCRRGGRSARGFRDRIRRPRRPAERETVARSPFGKVNGVGEGLPRPQALHERVTKPDGTASTRRVMESRPTEAW